MGGFGFALALIGTVALAGLVIFLLILAGFGLYWIYNNYIKR